MFLLVSPPLLVLSALPANARGELVFIFTVSVCTFFFVCLCSFPLPSSVSLAPLRFGAGLKGKILDSWKHCLPVVTTPIGSEGLLDSDWDECTELRSSPDDVSIDLSSDVSTANTRGGFGGGLGKACNAEEFAGDALRLYSDQALWEECSEGGNRRLRGWFGSEAQGARFLRALMQAAAMREERRSRNYVGVSAKANVFRECQGQGALWAPLLGHPGLGSVLIGLGTETALWALCTGLSCTGSAKLRSGAVSSKQPITSYFGCQHQGLAGCQAWMLKVAASRWQHPGSRPLLCQTSSDLSSSVSNADQAK